MALLFGIMAIFLQGIFSGSETAIMRANWMRILLQGKKKLALLEKREKGILTTLIGTNIFVVLASFSLSYFFVATLGKKFVFFALFFTTALSLLFGEFLPKAIAKQYPELWYEYLYPFIRFFNQVFSPFAFFVQRLISPLVKERRREFKLTRQDLLLLFGKERSERIAKAVLEFSQIKVKDVMIPLKFTVAIKSDSPPEVIYHILRESGYSRYPVYQERKDNIIGVVHAKDFLFSPDYKIRPPYFVSEDKKLREVFSEMRRGKDKTTHLAVVKDKNDKVIGILTLEDILEEIVGEIRSEI